MKLPGSARRVALGLMNAGRMSPGHHGGFSQLNGRDKALVKELVTGSERWKRFLDHHLSHFSRRPLGKVSPNLLNALRLGAYQIMFMGIPSYAAVDSVVGCVRLKSHRGFVNGVLRNVIRNLGHVEMPSLDVDPKDYAGLRYSFPDWMVERYFQMFPLGNALSLLKAQNDPPAVTLRVNRLKSDKDSLLRKLLEKKLPAEPGLLDVSIRITKGRSISQFPGYDEGLFSVQNEGASIVTKILDPQKGDVVWDMCAAPGGKTTHMAEILSETGLVVASDVDAERVGLVEGSSKRLGLENIASLVLDATDPFGAARALKDAGLPTSFDRVLVDAPCSGLGVINKHPDIKWNRKESDIGIMAQRQRLLLETAAGFLKQGGALVYSTCTFTHEENQDTWCSFLKAHKEFSPVNEKVFLNRSNRSLRVTELEMEKGQITLLPHVHGTDGFFVAKAVKGSVDISGDRPDSILENLGVIKHAT